MGRPPSCATPGDGARASASTHAIPAKMPALTIFILPPLAEHTPPTAASRSHQAVCTRCATPGDTENLGGTATYGRARIGAASGLARRPRLDVRKWTVPVVKAEVGGSAP